MRSVVQIYLGPPRQAWRAVKRVTPGGVAQLGERLPCTQEVIGSNPFTSTIMKAIVDFLWKETEESPIGSIEMELNVDL